MELELTGIFTPAELKVLREALCDYIVARKEDERLEGVLKEMFKQQDADELTLAKTLSSLSSIRTEIDVARGLATAVMAAEDAAKEAA